MCGSVTIAPTQDRDRHRDLDGLGQRVGGVLEPDEPEQSIPREALAVGTYDRPAIVAAVVLEHEESDRCRLGYDSGVPRDLPALAGLLCRGGHSRPPFCPSG